MDEMLTSCASQMLDNKCTAVFMSTLSVVSIEMYRQNYICYLRSSAKVTSS